MVGCSLGIALVGPDRDPDPDRLLGVADRAMYEAKSDGAERFVIRELT